MAKRYALVIGSNNYQSFPTLKKAEADALAVEKLLSDHVLGEFDSIVSLTQNVTNKETSIAIKRFFTDPNIEKDDFLLLFFAGHGHRDIIADKLYFAFEDSDEDFLEATALDCYHLRNWMRYSASKKQLVLLDCCYGGHFLESRDTGVKPQKTDFITEQGRFAITSAAKNKKAYESIEGAEHLPNSPFTQALIEGLSSDGAINSEGQLTAHGLHRYIKEQLLTHASSQEPKIFGPDGDNDLVLKTKKRQTLPEGLYKKLFSEDPDVRLGSISRLRRLVDSDTRFISDALEALIELEAKERDRHVYIDLMDLMKRLKEQPSNTTNHFDNNKTHQETITPTIITPSKTRQQGDVFQDKLKIGGFGPKMVVIPAGEFLMGSPDNEHGRYDNEGPQHTVKLNSFAMGETAVTFNDYEIFCNAVGKKLPGDEGWGKENRPVINVSWNDATDYIEWLNEQTGRIYRLPSEAQWEYACRAGTTTAYSTGAAITANQANFNFQNNKTVPVKSYKPNKFGLYDMHGNVWEWTQDHWHKNYDGAPIDGRARVSSETALRVVRGGCWSNDGRDLRSATRSGALPDIRVDGLGLRLSRGS